MNQYYKYKYLDLEIRAVEGINIVVNEAIDNLLIDIENIKGKKERMTMMLDFMLTTRVQMNLLGRAISSLDGCNNTFNLNGDKLPNKHIKPHSDNEFKKQHIKFRVG